MRVKINQVPDNKIFMLEVEPYYTGLTIKKKIEYFYDFACSEYALTYEPAKFKDESTVSDFDVEDGDIMNLIDPQYAAAESIPIHYRTPSGKDGTVYVQSSFTIDTLKIMIFGIIGVPPAQMRLLLHGKQLEGERTISDYNITENSTVVIMIRLCGS